MSPQIIPVLDRPYKKLTTTSIREDDCFWYDWSFCLLKYLKSKGAFQSKYLDFSNIFVLVNNANRMKFLEIIIKI